MGVRFLDSPAEAKPGRVRFLDEPAPAVETEQEPSLSALQKTGKFLFPTGATSPTGNLKEILMANLRTGMDVADWPKRAVDAITSLGGRTTGTKEVREALKSKVPGRGYASQNVKFGIDLALDPSTYLSAGIIKKAAKNIIGKGTEKYLTTTAKQLGLDVLPKTETARSLKKPVKEITETVGGAQILPSAAPKKTIRERMPIIGTRQSPADRSILAEALGKKGTAFTEYAKVARNAMINPRNPSPMDIAGRKAKEALDVISSAVNKVGAKKAKIIGKKADDFLVIDKVKDKFNKMVLERAGGVFDELGELVAAPGRQLRIDKADQGILKEINSRLSNNLVLVKEADDIKAGIRNAVDSQKATQVRQISTIAEGIGKAVRGDIDEMLVKKIGPKFRKVNTEYANLKNLQDKMNRRLGGIADPATGQTTHGASLMKSSIKSNEDRASKALFDQVRQITGIDLIQEAKYAEIAMKAVNDPRIKSLLEEVGVQVPLPGKTGAAVRLVQQGIGKVRPDPLSESVSYYLKQQKTIAKNLRKERMKAKLEE